MAEWSEVRKSELSADLRLDAQYYRPDILALRQTLIGSPFPRCRLEDISISIINFGAYSLCNDINFLRSGVRFITAENIHDSYIDFTDCRFISEEQHQRLLWKSQVMADQVLVSMAARLGFAAVYESHEPLNSSQDIAKVTLTDPSATDPFYIAAFINSRPGRDQLLAAQTGSVQQHTNLGKIKDLIVVLPPRDVQVRIAKVFRSAISEREKSLAALSKAEFALNSALGLDRVDLAPRLFYEDRFSRVADVGRFDAEHFQPKFTALLDTLRSTGIKLLRLGEIIKPVKNGFDCRDFCDEGTPYIRVGDVKYGRLEIEGCARIQLKAKDLPKDVTLTVGDILFTRKGSFGNAAHVRHGQEHAIISSEIMLIRRKPPFLELILPEYLALYFNSKAGALQAEKWAHGVAFYSISQDDLARFFIPILPVPMQQDLKTKTDEAESARQESCRLLDTAKRAVEIAIEGGEAAARKFLEGEGL